MTPKSIFVRFKGRVIGPISMERAIEFVKRGQITRQHEVSMDKLNWQPASQMPELFPNRNDAAKTDSGSQTQEGADESPVEGVNADWYANLDGTNQGPVNENEFKEWIAAGRVTRKTLVWRVGMVQWNEAGLIQPKWFAGKPPDPIGSANHAYAGGQLLRSSGQNEAQTSERVPTYLFSAILTTLFCCLPLGIVSIVFSSKVNSLLAKGDIEGAKRASRYARLWAQIGVWTILGPVFLTFLLALIIQIFFPDVMKNYTGR